MLRLGSLIRRQFQPIRTACFFSDDESARYPRKPSIEYDSNRENRVNLTGFVDQPVRIMNTEPERFSVFTSSSSTSSTLGSVSGRFLASRPLPLHTSSHYMTNGLPPLQAYSTLVIPEDNRIIEARISNVKRRLKERGIHADNCPPGLSGGLMCPQCEGGDSRKKLLSLLIELDGSLARWICHRVMCGFKGVVQPDDKVASASALRIQRKVTVEKLELEPLCDEVQDYFAAHGISKKTLARNRIMQRSIGDEILIAFTYWRRDQLVSCKYLYPNNDLAQEKHTEKILYGLNDIEGASEIIVVQTEIDKLSMEEAGLLDCVSVPESMDTEYKFLWNCNDYLKASRIIIAADGDVRGQAFAEEVARRLGKDRCYRVKWPKKNRDEHFKDVNEVLACMGPDSLKKAVKHAEPYPVEGLFPICDYFDEIDSFYHRRHGNEFGSSTGWENVDHIYTVVPGELTLVTGVPNCGKSEWIDALLVNLSHNVGWKFALCSMENSILDYSRKLIEKHLKKPLRDHKYARGIPRASVEEFEEGKQWLDDHFCSIWSGMDSIPSIDWVLDRARATVARKGIRGLVIDPYNELDHHRTNQTETEYVSQLLTKIKRFAEFHSCHVWLVAHPKQLQQWDGRAPNLYDVSGSAHFINKCDNGIIIHRNRDEGAGPLDLVQVGVRKVRNSVAGRIGDAYLSYDRATGLYSESPVALIKKRP